MIIYLLYNNQHGQDRHIIPIYFVWYNNLYRYRFCVGVHIMNYIEAYIFDTQDTIKYYEKWVKKKKELEIQEYKVSPDDYVYIPEELGGVVTDETEITFYSYGGDIFHD